MSQVEIIELDDSDKSVSEMVSEKAQMRAIKNRAGMLEKQYDRLLESKLEPGETVETQLGRVELTRGSAGNGYKVKDKLAYANWLYQHKRDDDVYPVPYPKETALSKTYLDSLVKESGELPDGVEPATGSAPTVRIVMDRTAESKLWQRNTLPEANLLLEDGGEL